MKSPKNIIMLSLDALRFDCVGYQPDKTFLEHYDLLKYLDTTELDKIAGKGVCFTQAVSTSSYTTASHASIFSGLYPPKHGIRSFFKTKLNPSVKVLAEILKESGFKTFHSSDEISLFSATDLTRGVDFCVSKNDRALFKQMAEYKTERLYLFAHFFDIHKPYLFSEYEYCSGYNDDFNKRRAELQKKYLPNEDIGEDASVFIRRLIKELPARPELFEEFIMDYVKGVTKFIRGRFAWFIKNLTALGLLENSLLIILSDHGETRYGNLFGHGGALNEDVIRIPLIIYLPDTLPSKIINAQVSSVDILPTILDILGINSCIKVHGKSLLPLITGTAPQQNSLAYSEFWEEDITADDTFGCAKSGKPIRKPIHSKSIFCQRTYRTPKYKFIFSGLSIDEISWKDEYQSLGNEEFIKKIYETFWLRLPTHDDIVYWNGRIISGELSKNGIKELFLNSPETRMTKQYVLKDISSDLLQEKELNIDNGLRVVLLNRVKKIVKAIEEGKVNEVPIPLDRGEEDIAVIKRLRDLGYIE